MNEKMACLLIIPFSGDRFLNKTDRIKKKKPKKKLMKKISKWINWRI